MLPAQRFTGITSERWAAIAAKVKEATGVAIANDAGHAAAHGFELGWSYDAAAATLTSNASPNPSLCRPVRCRAAFPRSFSLPES